MSWTALQLSWLLSFHQQPQYVQRLSLTILTLQALTTIVASHTYHPLKKVHQQLRVIVSTDNDRNITALAEVITRKQGIHNVSKLEGQFL